MKAFVYYKYGSPDVLELKEVDKPSPGDNDVLVKVHAASVNPLDWHSLRGKPFLQRMASGILKPKMNILGADVSGIIESVGSKVDKYRSGDEIIGDLYWSGFGAFAEYVSVPKDSIAMKPANVTFEEAAATPQAGITALHAVCDQGQVQTRQSVLVNGASGGVGTFAVQIAKSLGAIVTGVSSSRNLDMVRAIGADHTIDYTQEDFTKKKNLYDLIIDCVANHSLKDLGRVLSPKGKCVIVGFSTVGHMLKVSLFGPGMSKTSGKQLGMLMPQQEKKDMDTIVELLETGKIVPVIDKIYNLNELPEAIRYLEGGHARGKVVIRV